MAPRSECEATLVTRPVPDSWSTALPGGGGTPLAAGLKAAMQMSDEATRRGLTPAIAMLTDGRANINSVQR